MGLLRSCETPAAKRYQRDVLAQMGLYLVIVLLAKRMVQHGGGSHYAPYFWALLAAMPICGVIFRMGRYLHEETDEFQRMQQVYSILVGTAALLSVVVVEDFLRAFANTAGLPPFWAFLIFMFGMGAAGGVQRFRNRVRDEE
jgi:4-amino-4-deoxy-L-arabinose transferase-like glycosyltransferase